MMNIFSFIIKLNSKYKNQRKYLNSKSYDKYNKTQREIDKLYQDMHEYLVIKFLSRHTFVYCKCGTDLYDGSSEIIFSDDDTMELIICRKCGAVTCLSHEICLIPIKVDFTLENDKLHCELFGDNTKIYNKLNKLLEDYKNKTRGENI